MDDILYCFSFSDFSENGEVVPELLTALGYDFSSWRDAETKKLAHTLYFKTREEAETAKEQFEGMTDTLRDMEVSIGNLAVSELKKEEGGVVEDSFQTDRDLPDACDHPVLDRFQGEARTACDRSRPGDELRDRTACDHEVLSDPA